MKEEPLTIKFGNTEYMYMDTKNIQDIGEVVLFVSFEILKDITLAISEEEIKETKPEEILKYLLFCIKEGNTYKEITKPQYIHKLINAFNIDMKEIVTIPPILAMYLKFMTTANVGVLLATRVRLALLGGKNLEGEEKESFINEQLGVFKNIKEELGVDINLDRVDKRLQTLNVKKVNHGKIKHARAFYDPLSKTAYFSEKDIGTSNGENVRFHETIHHMTGKRIFLWMTLTRGLVEGMTESLASRAFKSEFGCEYIIRKNDKEAIYTRFNFDMETTYKELVCIIRQLEYLTNIDSAKSIVNGDTDFFKGIVEKLGPMFAMETVIQTLALNSLSVSNQYDQATEKLAQYQNRLLKKYFEKEFKTVDNKESSIELLKKLQKFEIHRAEIGKGKGDGIIEEDKTFEEYYNLKLEEVIQNYNLSEQEIQNLQYQKQEKKPINYHTEELCNNLAYSSIIKKGDYNPDKKLEEQTEVKVYETEEGEIICFLIDKDNNVTANSVNTNIHRIYANKNLIQDNEPNELYRKCKEGEIKAKEIPIEIDEEELKRLHKKCLEMQEMRLIRQKDAKFGSKSNIVYLLRNATQKVLSWFSKKENIKEGAVEKQSENENKTKEKIPSWDLRNWDKDNVKEIKGPENHQSNRTEIYDFPKKIQDDQKEK